MKIKSFCLILELAVLPAQHSCFHINEANVIPASLDFSYNNAVLYLEVQFKAFGPYPVASSPAVLAVLSHGRGWRAHRGVLGREGLCSPWAKPPGLGALQENVTPAAPSPTLPCPGVIPRVIFHSSLPGSPDPSPAPAGMRRWR